MYDAPKKCAAAHSVSVLQVHGSADHVIPYEGTMINGVPVPGARTTVNDWAAVDRCSPAPAAAGRLDVATAADTASGSPPLPGPETRVLAFRQHCAAGTEVQLWTVEGGGHGSAFNPAFARDLVDFLLAHPKS
jgi:poly(3-hydroxybutyrate) depolymerase